MPNFELVSSYQPSGDQPRAIQELLEGLKRGDKHQVLLGVTGSGKTYTMSNVIKEYNRPTLIISHNKTLAAQLYSEFKSFFPNNAVEFFISYYDYYQPEAYVVKRDLYIEKDFSVNEEIDRLRLKATTSIIDSITGDVIKEVESIPIYPAKYFVTTKDQVNKAIVSIEEELRERLKYYWSQEKYVEAQRLEQRTKFDIEMMREIGYCSGIENYSRHMDARPPGSRPFCLFDYFSQDYLLIVDESHVTIPQIHGMYNGDRSRKEVLVEYGFRLPSAMDNRPLKFEEYDELTNQVIYVSATPADYEFTRSSGTFVEQVIRPTGLLDPEIEIRPVKGQIDDLIGEIRKRVVLKQRILVTTLTKKMAEDLTDYLDKLIIKVRYIHSEVDALERVEIIRDLRIGDFDVLVGVNLLREGLDLPEVSLVGIIDADKEGFLRSERSLMQTAGRTARNVNGRVIMYADKVTESMRKTIEETNRRRKLQTEYNEANGITPTTIYKSVEEIMNATSIADVRKRDLEKEDATFLKVAEPVIRYMSNDQRKELLDQMMEEMLAAAKDLEFERAANLRDEIEKMKKLIK